MATTNFTTGTTITSAWCNDVDAHVYDEAGTDKHHAVRITVTPAGNITSTNVEDAINEIDGMIQPLDATLTSIAALGTAADKYLYTTGVDTWAEGTITAAARSLLDDASVSAMRTTLGVAPGTDTIPYVAPGTSGYVLTSDGAGNWTSAALPTAASQKLVQVQYSAIATANGSTTIPYDNTTPTSSEGTQIASVSITPGSASNKIEITASFLGGAIDVVGSNSATIIAALFRDTTCIDVVVHTGPQYSTTEGTLVFNIIDNPATTSAITYSIRVGVYGSTWHVGKSYSATFNSMADNNMIVVKELAI